MTVTLPESKRLELTTLIRSTWHLHRRSFTIKELASLLGMLRHACHCCRWGVFLVQGLQLAVITALRDNTEALAYLHRTFPGIPSPHTSPQPPITPATVCQSSKKHFITKPLARELQILHHMLAWPNDFLLAKSNCPLRYSIPRLRNLG